jgi:4-amino-4-deoxy-L-arabinose transferase-like glycosyltransferase
MNTKLFYLLLAVIILAGLLLSYVLYSGPFYTYDDLAYIMFSHQVLTGTFNPVQSPYAYGFLLPISLAASFDIFGVNTFASILPSLAEYITLILVSFAIARKLYGRNAGLFSAFFVATAPFVVGYSTRVLPDMGVGALAGISMLFLVYAHESNNGKLFYFLSGAFATMTIYVKLIGLAYMLAFFITLLVYRFYNKKRTTAKKGANNVLVYPLAGMLILLITYVAVMFAFSGSLFGAFIKYGTNQMTISPSNLNKNADALFTTLFGYNGFAPVPDPEVFPLGLIIFLALAGSVIGLIKKEKSVIYISAILWVAFLYLFFGTVTVTKYSYIFVVTRYFIMVSVPIAIIASYTMLSIYKLSAPRLKSKAVYLSILILLILIVSYIPAYNTLYNYNTSISGNARTLSSVLSYIKAEPEGRNTSLIIIDNDTANFLEFLSGYNKTTEIYTLNTSTRTETEGQLDSICVPRAANVYIIITYDNYSKLHLYETIFNDWINTSCSLIKLKSFTDNSSLDSAYNGMDIQADLYKVSYP